MIKFIKNKILTLLSRKKTVRIEDKEFTLLYEESFLKAQIKSVAQLLNNDLKDKDPLFVVVLNGSFMFAADLFKHITIDCKISFVKVASYNGTQTTGKVNEILGLTESIEGKTVVIIEDIVDTGTTITTLHKLFTDQNPAEIKVATLLFKPSVYNKDIKVDYAALAIPDKFVIGYGLDYNHRGRNLPQIYELKAT